jgi:acetyl esterase/lipase
MFYRPGLALDLHRPVAESPPLVVWVHGGAFRFGDRATLPPLLSSFGLFDRLTAHGFAVASVDYRLSDAALWPACVEDVVAAVEWLLASDLGLEESRVAIWGESAGGHLAVAAGLRLTPRIRGIVDWYGPMNFATMAAQGAPWTDAPDSPESRLLGAPLPTVPDLVARADPCHLVTADSPPALIMHGTADELVPYGQALHLAQAYEKAGARHTLVPVVGGKHCFPGRTAAETIDPVLRFLGDVLG